MVGHSRKKTTAIETSGTTGTTGTPGVAQNGAQVPTFMGPLLHDSMVTVRLSQPSLAAIHSYGSGPQGNDAGICLTDGNGTGESAEAVVLRDSIIRMADEMDDSDKDTIYEGNSSAAIGGVPVHVFNPMATDTAASTPHNFTPTTFGGRRLSDEDSGVNWEALERTEEQEPRNQDTEDSTALLLARLEQENDSIVSNPKSGLTMVDSKNAVIKRRRPLSIQQMQQMVDQPTPPQLRYSVIPAPPLTDLEFYTALVQDYKRTAQKLPTLLSKKIRAGIPPPLRGVVWQSMSGARDIALEEEYDRLCGESSPYTEIIGKDLGRSFPGVEMFRDPDGEGQRMLGKVLRCFSLYDTKIGYCQGLGFLVGPLLMHMSDRQAFCVLVRLMDAYDLRACFLPDLSGLHVRIYQFKELLKRHLSTLSAHLDHLQIEPAYVSQWFLSFFAVTCPLPMLFRIYDVIFAEGASETIMRVALSVMRKNEEKILACTEFEDVMQLLLSRGLWDCFHMDADEFVQDFVSLTGIVTREILQSLEKNFKEEKEAKRTAADSNDIFTAGSRFLGRIWNGTNNKTPTLNPGALAPHKKSGGFLRRSGSKQSMASSLNSVEASTDSMISTTTEATELSRKSSASVISTNVVVNQKSLSNTNKNLHSQIEDLLTALNEMQRDQTVLMTQLQREREEREEDRHVVWELIDILKKDRGQHNHDNQPLSSAESHESTETVKHLTANVGTIGDQSTEVLTKEGRKLSRHDSPLEDALADVPDEYGIVHETKATNAMPDHAAVKQELDDAFPAVAEHLTPDHVSEITTTTEQSPHGTPRHISLQTPPRRTSIYEAKNYIWDDEAFSSLLSSIESRFAAEKRPSSGVMQSKSQLRDDLKHSKEQLACEITKTQDLQRRLHDADVELNNLREQIREGHVHIRNGLQEKNRLEKLVQDLRSKVAAASSAPAAGGDGDAEPRRASVHAGLRELKLGRNNVRAGPTPVFNKRSSSLHNVAFSVGKENDSPPPMPSPGLNSPNNMGMNWGMMSPSREAESPLESPMGVPLPPTPGPEMRSDNDALILELVQAKTAEAEAKQEAEEAKAKLESLRRLLSSSRVQGDGNGHPESPLHQKGSSVNLSPWSMSMGRKDSESSAKSAATTPGSIQTGSSTPTPSHQTTPASAHSGGGFWGWGKRSVSLAEGSPAGSR